MRVGGLKMNLKWSSNDLFSCLKTTLLEYGRLPCWHVIKLFFFFLFFFTPSSEIGYRFCFSHALIKLFILSLTHALWQDRRADSQTRGVLWCFAARIYWRTTETDPGVRMRKWFVLFLFFGGWVNSREDSWSANCAVKSYPEATGDGTKINWCCDRGKAIKEWFSSHWREEEGNI